MSENLETDGLKTKAPQALGNLRGPMSDDQPMSKAVENDAVNITGFVAGAQEFPVISFDILTRSGQTALHTYPAEMFRTEGALALAPKLLDWSKLDLTALMEGWKNDNLFCTKFEPSDANSGAAISAEKFDEPEATRWSDACEIIWRDAKPVGPEIIKFYAQDRAGLILPADAFRQTTKTIGAKGVVSPHKDDKLSLVIPVRDVVTHEVTGLHFAIFWQCRHSDGERYVTDTMGHKEQLRFTVGPRTGYVKLRDGVKGSRTLLLGWGDENVLALGQMLPGGADMAAMAFLRYAGSSDFSLPEGIEEVIIAVDIASDCAGRMAARKMADNISRADVKVTLIEPVSWPFLTEEGAKEFLKPGHQNISCRTAFAVMEDCRREDREPSFDTDFTVQVVPAGAGAYTAEERQTQRARAKKLAESCRTGAAVLLDVDATVARLGGGSIRGNTFRCVPPGRSDNVLLFEFAEGSPTGFKLWNFARPHTEAANHPDDVACVCSALGIEDGVPGVILSDEEIEARIARNQRAGEEQDLINRRISAAYEELLRLSTPAGELSTKYFDGRGGLPVPPECRETSHRVTDEGDPIPTRYPRILLPVYAFTPDMVLDKSTWRPNGMHLTSVTQNPDGTVANFKTPYGGSLRRTPQVKDGGFILVHEGGVGSDMLVVGEGAESTASVLKLGLSELEGTDFWALSLMNAQNFARLPVIAGVRRLVIAVDNDKRTESGGLGVGVVAARDLANRYAAEGVEVILIIPNKDGDDAQVDCNDALKDQTGVTTVRLAPGDVWNGGEEADYTDAGAFADGTLNDAPDPNTLDAGILELNRRFFLAPDGGYAWVVEKTFNPGAGGTVYKWHKTHAFEQMFMNRMFPEPGQGSAKKGAPKKMIGLGAAWLRSAKRRQHLGGVQFDPQCTIGPDCFNMWEGFAFTPKKGDWSKNRKFIIDVICNGNEEYFAYMLKWMARAVQFPWLQGEVAVILCSEEGTGKGFFVRSFMKLFGPHVQHISESGGITGEHTEHLEHTVVVFCDEAFFAGDKANSGKLLASVTEPTLSINPKGRARKQVRNCLHFLMASNRRWVVAASKKARRWFVLDVSHAKQRNPDFFAELQRELDNGGYEAMLHELLHEVDLTGFHPVNFPETEALRDQKLQSLEGMERWWFDSLMRGYIMESRYKFAELEAWHETVTSDFVRDAYTASERSHGNTRFTANEYILGNFLLGKHGNVCQAVKKDLKTPGKGVAGEALLTERVSTTLDGVPSLIERKNPVLQFNEKRTPGYNLGSLAKARADFCAAYNITIEWPPEEGAPHAEEDGEDLFPDCPF